MVLASALAGIFAILPGCAVRTPYGPAARPAAAGAVAPLVGEVFFGLDRHVAATIDQVANGATVSLIDPVSGNTIASAVTTPSGEFQITLGASSSLQPSTPYYLEAVKGLNQNAVGNSVARVRTIVEYGNSWQSLTGGQIDITESTTAICALANHDGLSSSQIQALLGTVTIGALDTSLSPSTPDSFTPTSGITNAQFHGAYEVVSSALAVSHDPLAETNWAFPYGYHYALPITMTDAGGYTRSNVLAGVGINFSTLLGASGSLDPNSPMIWDVDNGQALQTCFTPTSTPSGTVSWIVPQVTSGSVHHFMLYFDTTADGSRPAGTQFYPPVVSYYDPNYAMESAPYVDQFGRDLTADLGAPVLDAAQVGSYMQWVIANKISDTTVVISVNSMAPDTILTSNDTSALIRQYLDAGGRVIWGGDVQLYYLATAGGGYATVTDSGPVLGFSCDGPWSLGNTVSLTAAATTWGISQTWVSNRPSLAADFQGADDVIFATDSQGDASGWLKNFDSAAPYSGFLRIWDFGLSEVTSGEVSDLEHVATYRQGGTFTLGSVQTL